MLKKSNLYTTLTQSDEPIWKDDWRLTLNNIEFSKSNINIEKLNTFLNPVILENYLPKDEKEASIIKNMIKISNKLDNNGTSQISDKLEKLIRGFLCGIETQ